MDAECPMDPIMQEDLEMIAGDMSLMREFDGCSILVTGATGLIGSQIVYSLLCSNRINGTRIEVIALVRNIEKATAVFGNVVNRDEFTLLQGDVSQPLSISEGVDYIVHAANPTSSRYFVSNPVETIEATVVGTYNALTLAKEKNVKGFVYLSSLEVYGKVDCRDEFLDEAHYGYIDPLEIRSSYSEGKRMAECLCSSFASEYGIPVKVARLAQTFGPGVEYSDGRVFAEFARSVIEGKDIVLHTAGRTIRTYCYTKDAVAAILTLLLKGKKGEAYNVANMDTAISIRDMAQLVSGLCSDKNIEVRFDVPDDLGAFGYNPEMVVRLNTEKINRLGWTPTVELKEMYQRMIRSLMVKKDQIV